LPPAPEPRRSLTCPVSGPRSTSACSSGSRPNSSAAIPSSPARPRRRAPATIISNPCAFPKRSATVVFPLPGGPLIAMIIGVLVLGGVLVGGFVGGFVRRFLGLLRFLLFRRILRRVPGVLEGLPLGRRELRDLPECLQPLSEREVLADPLADLPERSRQEAAQADRAREIAHAAN